MAWLSGQELQDGKYTIEKELGEGGFGITYRARDNQGNFVVIKTVNDAIQKRADFAKFQQDFLNEAIKLAKCSHSHIVQIYEVIHENDLWCMVMEYIDGEDLGSFVENQGILSETEALRYVQQIGSALTVVHDNGLLHRDIKPQNIMLRSGKSEAVLIDFGIAREFTPNLTKTHTKILSDGFAPIEQYDARAKRGAFTDVYALAATLYSVLTGELPTISPMRAIGTELEEAKKINSSISDKVNQAIIKGMEIKPENRPQSISEWLGLLDLNEIYLQPQVTNIPSVDVVNFEQIPNLLTNKLFNKINNYSKLEELLINKKWQSADEWTKYKILEIMGLQEQGYFMAEDIKNFPCQALQTIDQLWVKYSKGRFGFSIQKKIWEKLGGKAGVFNEENWVLFGEYVGWRSTRNHQILFAGWTTREWCYYSEINFSENALEGHLPRLWDEWRGGYELSAILLRLEVCNFS
jgi:serine/threonine protein kinase